MIKMVTNEKQIEKVEERKPSGRGGWRPGSGRKVGTKLKSTIEKETILKTLQDEIARHATPIIIAQLVQAVGYQEFYTKKKRGKGFRRVKSEKEMLELLEKGKPGKDYFVRNIGGDWRAAESLLNRAFGRPKETIDHNVNVRSIADVVSSLEDEN